MSVCMNAYWWYWCGDMMSILGYIYIKRYTVTCLIEVEAVELSGGVALGTCHHARSTSSSSQLHNAQYLFLRVCNTLGRGYWDAGYSLTGAFCNNKKHVVLKFH